MQNKQMLSAPSYDPGYMLDKIIKLLGLKNDAQLCLRLEISPPIISKIRNKKIPLGDLMLIHLHEETGLAIREIRRLAGINATKIERRRSA